MPKLVRNTLGDKKSIFDGNNSMTKMALNKLIIQAAGTGRTSLWEPAESCSCCLA